MTLTIFLTDLIEICTFLTDMFISLMSVFMEPPLSIFIGMVIFYIIIRTLVKYLLFSNNKSYTVMGKNSQKMYEAGKKWNK